MLGSSKVMLRLEPAFPVLMGPVLFASSCQCSIKHSLFPWLLGNYPLLCSWQFFFWSIQLVLGPDQKFSTHHMLINIQGVSLWTFGFLSLFKSISWCSDLYQYLPGFSLLVPSTFSILVLMTLFSCHQSYQFKNSTFSSHLNLIMS